MIGLDDLCLRFAVPPAEARAALAAEHHDPTPWYLQAVLGFGGWISALAILVFVIAFLALAIGLDEPGWEAVVAGALLLGGAAAWLRTGKAGLFGLHFAIATATAGAVLVTGGFGVQTESLWGATAVAAALAAIGTLGVRSLILQFLLTAMAVVLAAIALEDRFGAGAVDPLSAAAPIGLFLVLRPPRLDLRPLAAVLLLATPFAAAVLDLGSMPALSFDRPEGWPARIVHLALFLVLIGIGTQRGAVRPGVPALGGALLAALVSLLLPAGAAAALLLMMLGYTLGHRPYALIGSVLAVWFIWQFYYALEIGLLAKSVLLAVVGTACLFLYGAVALLDRQRSA